MDLAFQLNHLLTMHRLEPAEFWRKWEALVTEHHLSPEDVAKLQAGRAMPPRINDASHLIRSIPQR